MPKGVYIRTPETRANISAAKKGKSLSLKHCDSISKATTGYGFLEANTRKMSSIEQAYVGAMIDTDGCVYWNTTSPKNKRKRTYPTLNFTNTNPELISSMLRLTGVGSVSTYQKNKYKRQYKWTIGRTKSVIDILKQIFPYSIKAQRLLSEINTKKYILNLENSNLGKLKK